MSYFCSLYSSEIYSVAIRLSYNGHLETKKNFCHCKALKNRPELPVSKQAGSPGVPWVLTAAAPARGAVKNPDGQLLAFISCSYTSVPLPFKVYKASPIPSE